MNLRLLVVSTVGALALFFATATAARAQSAIAGSVRDSTGAVMPGVTVEVSSPALIERTRTAITDGQGLYQVVNLPPGSYGVTFTLPGFTTVQRSDVDVPGKDSWVHRQSGASEVLVSSTRRWALMHELRGAPEPRLQELLAKMAPVDLVLVEGFKREPHRKIEVHRGANGKPWLFPDDPGIVGIVTDAAVETKLPVVHLDDIEATAVLIKRSAISIEDLFSEATV